MPAGADSDAGQPRRRAGLIMCFKAPKVVERDPAADAEKAAAEAQQKANAETALARQRKRRSALDTGAGASTALAQNGRRTLGGE